MGERQYWAQMGKKKLGPFDTQKQAKDAGEAVFGVKKSWSTGYGTYGAHFDIRFYGKGASIVGPTMRKNPRKRKTKRIAVKRKTARKRSRLSPIPKRRAKNVRIVRARKNPYVPYVVYGDARPHRAKAGRVARYYWTGYKFTTDKKYAEHFPNAESAFNTCKRIRNRLPDALEFVAVQRAF